ncbi:MAG: hypothetical protein JKY31_08135 [Rhodobacteraceae bacterium]|nr:hypothetical protein [Paracoccaceae bacterium]
MRCAIFALTLCAAPLAAEPPLSAIDWLSESLSQPPRFVITPPSPLPNLWGNHLIISSALDLVSRDAAGLLSTDITGFPTRLWGDMPADAVIAALQNHQPRGVIELHKLYRNILLAQADPPIDTTTHLSPLMVRIDLLIELGAMDEAETLIGLAGVTEPEVFKRWFDVAVLANRTLSVCNALTKNPDLSDDISVRVICLARGGDWNAAAITLSLSASIGDVERPREELLIQFLDPELFAGVENPAVPDPLTAIDFALREALGMPRPNGTLPLMFLSVDMGLQIPQRRRMEAAERLVQSAAIPTALLFAAYRGGRPASSGGIWERANAVQNLDKALIGQDDVVLADALAKAYHELGEIGLIPAMAEEYADALAHRDCTDDLASVAHIVQSLLLLENTPIAAWSDSETENESDIEMARILASQIPVLGLSPYDDPILTAIHAAFADQIPQLGEYDQNKLLVESGNIGAAVLKATDLLSDGRSGDPAFIHEGLFILRKAGLEDSARRAAIQILLLPLEAP